MLGCLSGTTVEPTRGAAGASGYANPEASGEQFQKVCTSGLDQHFSYDVFLCDYRVNRQGIIGISRVIDHLIWQEDVIEDDSNRTYDCVDDLPDGVAQKAAKYIGR